MARPSRYSPELRRRAIEEVIDRDRKVVEVAASLQGVDLMDQPLLGQMADATMVLTGDPRFFWTQVSGAGQNYSRAPFPTYLYSPGSRVF